MEAVERLIPTLSHAKIGHTLSYPVGAEKVSLALAPVAQFPNLKLHFYFWSDHPLRRGNYEFLRVEYLRDARPQQEWPILELYKRAPQYMWEIVVHPVPRVLRHRIHEHILNSALPQVVRWLDERNGLNQQRNDILAFFYDEKAQEFTARQLTRLEPLRT